MLCLSTTCAPPFSCFARGKFNHRRHPRRPPPGSSIRNSSPRFPALTEELYTPRRSSNLSFFFPPDHHILLFSFCPQRQCSPETLSTALSGIGKRYKLIWFCWIPRCGGGMEGFEPPNLLSLWRSLCVYHLSPFPPPSLAVHKGTVLASRGRGVEQTLSYRESNRDTHEYPNLLNTGLLRTRMEWRGRDKYLG